VRSGCHRVGVQRLGHDPVLVPGVGGLGIAAAPRHTPGRTRVRAAAGDGVVAGNPSFKASRRSTTGSMTVIESRTTGGAALHVHAFDDEIFYVLDGVMTVG